MNSKGFTLIELLAVIIVIAIIATATIIGISGYIKLTKEEYYDVLQGQIKLAAKSYYSDNKMELVNLKKVTIKTLEDNNYIKQVLDTNGNACLDSYVTVLNIDGEYDYNVCLICNQNEIICDKK